MCIRDRHHSVSPTPGYAPQTHSTSCRKFHYCHATRFDSQGWTEQKKPTDAIPATTPSAARSVLCPFPLLRAGTNRIIFSRPTTVMHAIGTNLPMELHGLPTRPAKTTQLPPTSGTNYEPVQDRLLALGAGPCLMQTLLHGCHLQLSFLRISKILRRPKNSVDKGTYAVSYTHLRAHETVLDLVCRLLLEKKK